MTSRWVGITPALVGIVASLIVFVVAAYEIARFALWLGLPD